MYNIQGDILAEFPTVNDASNTIGISRNNISQCLKGCVHTAGGYVWKYKNYNKVSANSNIHNNPFPTRIFKNKIGVLQYDLDGNFIKEYESLTLAAKENNLLISHISNCINGNRSCTGGYMWKSKTGEIKYKIDAYKTRPKRARKVLKYDTAGNFICEYESMEEACKAANISRGTLMKYIASKSYNEFIWKFKSKDVPLTIKTSDFIFKSKSAIPVLKCDLQGNILQEFPNIAIASKKSGVSRTHIYNSLAGHGKNIDNCKWKYK